MLKEPKPKDSSAKKPQQKKDLGMLLKRIMMLDDNQKTQIELILEQIEKGKLDNQALLQLNFLSIKKDSVSSKLDDCYYIYLITIFRPKKKASQLPQRQAHK